MRDYTRIAPRFWTGDTGRALRKNPNAQRLAFYLLSCPAANMIGLFYVASPTICHEVGFDEATLASLWFVLEDLDFAYHDAETEMVWVTNMAREQLDDALKPGDRRVAGVVRQLDSVKRHRFARRFWDRYAEAFSLVSHPEAIGLVQLFSGPPRSPASTACAPSKPNAPSGEDQDQEKALEQEQEQALEEVSAETGGPAPAPLSLLTFPCSGLPRAWGLTAGQVGEWTELYPAADVISECRKALGWIGANPTRRKTARGMPAFLTRWLGKCQDRGGASPVARLGGGSRADHNLSVAQELLNREAVG